MQQLRVDIARGRKHENSESYVLHRPLPPPRHAPPRSHAAAPRTRARHAGRHALCTRVVPNTKDARTAAALTPRPRKHAAALVDLTHAAASPPALANGAVDTLGWHARRVITWGGEEGGSGMGRVEVGRG